MSASTMCLNGYRQTLDESAEMTSEDSVTGSLSVKDLNFFYGDRHSLKSINLTYQKNKITALIGPSGSGKSTLLRTLNLIYKLHPSHKATGEVLFHGQNILQNNIDANLIRSKIGMVFQKPTPFPMSVFDNIAFAIKCYDRLSKAELAKRVELVLRQAALWDEVKDRLYTPATGLSGGQQQRLCIARTIAIRPEILLLDEPTASLDPVSTAKIEELIVELKSHMTIVLVTHNLAQAKRVADYTAFLQAGNMIEYSQTDSLFNNPVNELTRDYITHH